MDETEPQPGNLLDKAWAIAGLLAGAALIFMAIDLLRPHPKPGVPDDGE
jgi:hypothetical protein